MHCHRNRNQLSPESLNALSPESGIIKCTVTGIPESPESPESLNALSPESPLESRYITDILNSCRFISADTALRLARYFGNSAPLWLDLQSQHDIAVTEREVSKEIMKRVHRADAEQRRDQRCDFNDLQASAMASC